MAEDLIGLEDAEREAERAVRRGIHKDHRAKDIIVEDARLDEIGEIPIYKVRGTAVLEIKGTGGILSSPETEERMFEIQVNTKNGEVVGRKF